MEEEQQGLTWSQKRKVKKLIKKGNKKISAYKKGEEKDKVIRTKLIKSLLELEPIFDITNDDGSQVTEESLKKETTKELIDLFEQALEMLEKIL